MASPSFPRDSSKSSEAASTTSRERFARHIAANGWASALGRAIASTAIWMCIVCLAVTIGIVVVQSSAEGRRVDPQTAAAPLRFKAVAFDALVLFNPDSVVSEVERILPGRGAALTNVWRARQFEYSWLRSM